MREARRASIVPLLLFVLAGCSAASAQDHAIRTSALSTVAIEAEGPVTLPRPVSWHRFDGSWADSSGHGWTPNVHGASLTTDRNGDASHAAGFDGTDDYIDLWQGRDRNVAFDLTTFTVALQFHADALLSNDEFIDATRIWLAHETLVSKVRCFMLYAGRSGGSTYGRLVYYDAGGAVRFEHLTARRWYHVAVVRTPTTIKLYLDGALVATTQATAPTEIHSSAAVYIGAEVQAQHPFDGKLDDVRVYASALNDAQIATFRPGPAPAVAPVETVGAAQ